MVIIYFCHVYVSMLGNNSIKSNLSADTGQYLTLISC